MHYVINGKYPINNKEQVKIASEYFGKHINKFLPTERMHIAGALEKRANELRISNNEAWITNYSRGLKKTAELSPDFVNGMVRREDEVKDSGLMIKMGETKVPAREALQAITKVAVTNPHKAMFALDEFDKQAGLKKAYDTAIPDHVMTVFGSYNNPEYDSVPVTEKLSHYQAIRIRDNDEVLEKIAEAFGENVKSSAVSNPISFLRNLSDPEKTLVDEML